MSEDQDLLSRISQLAGHINLHKGHQSFQQGSTLQDYSGSSERSYTGSSPGQTRFPSQISRGHRFSTHRGSGGRQSSHGFAHRNRSLVLSGHDTRNVKEPGVQPRLSEDDVSQALDSGRISTSTTKWILRRDRHMQLINASVYDKEANSRNKAIEETRQQKVFRRDLRERQKIDKHLRLMPTDGMIAQTSIAGHSLVIGGLKFLLSAGGSKLIRQRTPADYMDPSPKTALIAGVTFLRSKNGNLYRSGLVKAKRNLKPIKRIQAPCRRFSTTGTINKPSVSHPLQLVPVQSIQILTNSADSTALFLGQCSLGPRCAYIHDPSKVAICRIFLRTGDCPCGSHCDLSHEPTYARVPACSHFLRGRCGKSECRYAHVRVNTATAVCRAFTTLGYCPEGSVCNERHVFECPDYSSNGECRDAECRLPHIDRAAQLRHQAASVAQEPQKSQQIERDDLSSDESASSGPHSDDIDSDGLEDELLSRADLRSENLLSKQEDFVQF